VVPTEEGVRVERDDDADEEDVVVREEDEEAERILELPNVRDVLPCVVRVVEVTRPSETALPAAAARPTAPVAPADCGDATPARRRCVERARALVTPVLRDEKAFSGWRVA